MNAPPLVVLSCGEASGDLYLAHVARALKQRRPDLRLAGIAGPGAREAGVEPWVRSEELAVMGFAEIVRHLPRLRSIGLGLVDRAEREGAALFLPVDYPGFHLRVGERMRNAGIPVLDFIPPKTWSWGRGRLKSLRRAADRCAVIFPFELEHYGGAGIATHFVGHPLVDIHAAHFAAGEVCREGVLLAPGSRRQELARLLPAMADAVRRLRDAGFVEPIRVSQAVGTDGAAFAELESLGVQPSDAPLIELLASHRAALVCSGTATMEAALSRTPHLIVYRTGALTYRIARMVAAVQHIGMANIVLDRRAYPELIQSGANGQAMADGILTLLATDGIEAERQRRAGQELHSLLGGPGCFDRVAELAVEMIATAGGSR